MEYNEKSVKKNIFQKIGDYLRSPGRQFTVQSAAPTQFVNKHDEAEEISIVGAELPSNESIYDETNRRTWGNKVFDFITDFAGSRIMFLFTIAILIAWAIWGGITGAPDEWQIVMQDGSSIQCYISDTLLMRQQQNHSNRLLTIIAQLRSRNATVDRLIRRFTQTNVNELDSGELDRINKQVIQDDVGDAANLPTENLFDRICNWGSVSVGSLWSLLIYSGGIFAWVGVGHSLGWSDEWQLYINTGVAVELTFTSMFLQNTRRRHMEYLEKCLKRVKEADTELEIVLRQSTNDNQPNPVVGIRPHPVSRGVRIIDYYGDVIGTGLGAFISICVFIAWFSIGNVMEWSDDWWLIIGTYTGLVGFVDGFVLRNVYFRQDTLLDEQFDVIDDHDGAIFQYININNPSQGSDRQISFSEKVSNYMGDLCSRPMAVLFSFIVVIALICIASGMHWTATGQLLCNTPTMIIEGFLLIVLLHAHNMSNTTRRFQMHDILLRRLKLVQYVRAFSNGESDVINEKQVQDCSDLTINKK